MSLHNFTGQSNLITEWLKARKDQHFDKYEIAAGINENVGCVGGTLGEMVRRNLVKGKQHGRRYLYCHAEPIVIETRTFVQKPHKFDQAMIDRLNQIKADRLTLPSKTNTDDAGELSVLDRNKLRMMGSGN